MARWEAEPACRATRLASEEERSLRGGKASFYTVRTAAAGRGAGRLQRGVASAASASAIPRVAHPHTEASGGAAHELFVGTIAWRSTRPWAFLGRRRMAKRRRGSVCMGVPLPCLSSPRHISAPPAYASSLWLSAAPRIGCKNSYGRLTPLAGVCWGRDICARHVVLPQRWQPSPEGRRESNSCSRDRGCPVCGRCERFPT